MALHSNADVEARNALAFTNLLAVIESARQFGFRRESNGAQLYGYLPHIGDLAYLHSIHPGLNDAELVRLAETIQRPIPSEYEWWLTRTNGFTLFMGALDFYGLVRVFSRNPENRQPFDLFLEGEVQRRVLRADPRMFFFGGSAKAKGFRFYMDTANGQVHRCSRQSAEPLQSWAGIAALLETEVPRLAGLYDDAGRLTVDGTQVWSTLPNT